MRITGVAWAARFIVLWMVASSTAHARDVIIHAGHLIDGVSKTVRDQVSILIKDDRITDVRPGFVTVLGSEVIDLSQATVLPGLIDCHVHMAILLSNNPIADTVTRTRLDDAYSTVLQGRRTLEAGFTTVRDVGDDTDLIVAMKRAIANGEIPGPRMYVSGAALSPTGGHGDSHNGLDPELMQPQWDEALVDGPEAVRQRIRLLRRRGVDLIKILPSGGVLSIGDNPTLQLMTDDEIKAAVDTAHALGMKVAAHAMGPQTITHAAALGVDSIEHGVLADEASFKMMKAHGTYLVPTLLIAQTVYDKALHHPEQLPPTTAAKVLDIVPRLRDNLGKAYRAGVKIAFGTDDVLDYQGNNAQEFALMVNSGMPPMEAILAATGNAADLIGASQNIGSIQAGRFADVIAVAGDPLKDVTQLEHVGFVMKGGVVVKSWTTRP